MSDAEAAMDPQQLIGLLREQREVYRELQVLSAQQRSLIASDSPEQLLNVLSSRQRLVTRLAELNRDLGPFRRAWSGSYADLPEAIRSEAQGLLEEINQLLGVILRTDQEDSALLSARKQAVGQNLSQVNDNRTASAAYARHAGRSEPQG